MVDHNHLYADHGVTPPQPQLKPDVSSDNGMDSSSDARMGGFEDTNSQKSLSSSGNSNDLELGNGMNQNQISEIFKAAQQLSYNDRIDAAETRKKNLELIAYIEAMGHSLQEVNNFTSKSGRKAIVNDDNTRSVNLATHEMDILDAGRIVTGNIQGIEHGSSSYCHGCWNEDKQGGRRTCQWILSGSSAE